MHNGLGNVLRDQGKREEAADEYRKAVRLSPPGLPWLTTILAPSLHDQGKREEAAAEYRKAAELDPKSAGPHYNLGNVLKGQGKKDEATAEYRKAAELDPKFAQAHGALGLLLLQTGGPYAEGRQAFQRRLDLLAADDPLRKLVSEQIQTCERMIALEAKLSAVLKGERGPPTPRNR